MLKTIRILFTLLLAFSAANIADAGITLHKLEHSVIRLHILANSDSTADQTEKLLVRDALIAGAENWIPANSDFTAGCEALSAQLQVIRETAEQTLRAAGCSDEVRVTLEQTDFQARQYGSMTLPAGSYQALRVEIGEAAGQNWWCVMYPAICIPAASEPTLALDADAENMVLHPEEYEVRLKCLDAARAVGKWLSVKLSCFRISKTDQPSPKEEG
ncbi:MAG: stage II sporulation protein R [Oscillospiraceae bacterium]|nr:stage II sporulation protein R [Oscillospiraceae bacterium]